MGDAQHGSIAGELQMGGTGFWGSKLEKNYPLLILESGRGEEDQI